MTAAKGKPQAFAWNMDIAGKIVSRWEMEKLSGSEME